MLYREKKGNRERQGVRGRLYRERNGEQKKTMQRIERKIKKNIYANLRRIKVSWQGISALKKKYRKKSSKSFSNDFHGLAKKIL